MKQQAHTEKPPAASLDPASEARAILSELSIDGQPRLGYWRDEFRIYTHGAYRAFGKHEVRGNVVKFLNRGYSGVKRHVTSDVFDQVSALSLLPSSLQPRTWVRKTDQDWPAKQIIVAKNGLVNLPMFAEGASAEDCIRPGTPRFFTLWSLDFPVDPRAVQPLRWLAFLQELWGDDPQAIDALQEIFGYILCGGTGLQKIFMFYGPKRAGKGVIARVLRALNGPDNCAGPTLASLAGNFGLQPLVDRNLAVLNDARLSGRVDQAITVERLLSISGEDAQTVDRKHMVPLTVTLPTRLLLVTNELTWLRDASGAMASRIVMLRFQNSFYGAENPRLTDELLTELPSIFRWAIEGWSRLSERGHFVQPDSAKELLSDMEDLGSPVSAFVRERCIVDGGYRASVADLFAEWKSWCEEKGRKDVGHEQHFGRDLRAAFPGLKRTQPRDDSGGRFRAYEGIGIRAHETGGF